MDPEVVRRLRAIWFAALVCVTGTTLIGYGFVAAVLTAVAFFGATVLAVVAFFLWFLLGDYSVPLRVLMLALVFGGLFVELGAILEVFKAVR